MVRTVTSTALTLQTDFIDSPPPIHCGGILAGSSSSSGTVFCWIANSTAHLSVAVDHLVSKNFDSDALEFIPYSTKDAWTAAYPFAIPSLEVNADGQLVHSIQHSLTSEQLSRLIASGNPNTIHYDPEATAGLTGSSDDASKKYPQLQQRKKSRRAGMELLSDSVLTNAERDVLHVEIFKYFAWLKVALEEVEVTHAGKRLLGNACASSDKVQECCDVVESTFAVVKKNVGEDIGYNGGTSGSPLLEKVLGEELAKLVVKVPLRGGSHKREQGDFENYWSRLVEFKEKNGHSNVPTRYKDDLKLGKWVSNIRQKRKSLDAQGLEACEPKAKKGPSLGAVTLTKDRIDRFNAIGFAWDLTGPTQRQSWEERFEQMMEYYRENGRWPPHSHGTLGEWVHKQRCKWAKKDPVFMTKHYQKLEDVGFLWKVKERLNVSWEARLQQLAEFGRLNGHFQVPNPDYEENNLDNPTDETSIEAIRFYKWVNGLHGEYEVFKNGGESKILNNERVVQLIKMGFQFGGVHV